jgi:hypothetical protein
MSLAGGSLRFFFCIFWQVQDVPDACWIHPADLCIVFLLFQNRRKEKGEKRLSIEQMLLTVPTLRLPWLLCAIKCYFSGSVVEHYVHPMYWWFLSKKKSRVT